MSLSQQDRAVEVDGQSLGQAIRAVEQPGEDLACARIHNGNLEFACLGEMHVVLSSSRISLEGSPTDSADFELERRTLEHLAARGGSVEVHSDETMLAFRSGDHVYSTISRADREELNISPREYPVRMDGSDYQFRRLVRQIDAPHVRFSTEDGDLHLSGGSANGQIGGSVHVPSDRVTIASKSDCQTLVTAQFLTRVLHQLPSGAECTMHIDTDMPLCIVSDAEPVETRHVIAPRIRPQQGEFDD